MLCDREWNSTAVDLPSSETVKVIYALLPGFLTAWVFYGLTAHPKLGAFERAVQALIFTAIVQAVVLVIRGAMLWLGQVHVFGLWTEDRGFVLAIVVAILLGHVVARIANNDSYHSFLRDNKWLKRLKLGGITTRTSYPSEWFSALHRDKRYVTLHLDGGRRLYGWPYEWPDQPDSGQFVIMEPEWILDDNTRAVMGGVERIIIPAKDVEMVECLKFNREITAPREQLEAAERMLVDLNVEPNNDASDGKRE